MYRFKKLEKIIKEFGYKKYNLKFPYWGKKCEFILRPEGTYTLIVDKLSLIVTKEDILNITEQYNEFIEIE